jgi:hypothetical protein
MTGKSSALSSEKACDERGFWFWEEVVDLIQQPILAGLEGAAKRG